MKALRCCFWIGIFSIVLMTGACKFGNVSMTILQTSDVHHHASGYGPFLDYTPLDTADEDCVLGGYARLGALIKDIRAKQARKGVPTLLFDSGDFLMGTVYDLTADNPIAMQFFSQMGYNAVTLGNHEFDWSPQGLAMLLMNARANGFSVPVVATNAVTDPDDPGDDGVEYLCATGAIVNKTIIELPGGGKVGILGLMGEDADEKAPVAPPVTFNHDYAFIQGCVDDLRNNDGVHLVVVLSHGGVEQDGTGDDADLAANVTGIDIIASGHFHTATHEAQVAGPSETIIFSPGEYGEYLSRLDITYNIFLRKIVKYTFTLIEVDDTTAGDPATQGLVDGYHAEINADLAENLDIQLDSPITATTFDLEKAPLQVSGIGSLCADSLRAVASKLASLNGGIPCDVSIVASGVIRDDIYPGRSGVVTFSDVFNMLPLGLSPYDPSVPGYPLMSIYASAADIYKICEVGLTFAPMMGSDYYLNFSGIKIDYNPAYAQMLQGVRAVYVCPVDDTLNLAEGTLLDPADTGLYHIVVDLYALQMLNVVNNYLIPAGIAPVVPRDADGNPVDFSNLIGYRIDAGGGQELKEWMAPLKYLPGLGGSIPAGVYGPGGTFTQRVNFVAY